MNDNLVEIRNVYKNYHLGHKELNVLKGISLTIKKGGFVSIVGPSGAGKSTLLYIMSTLDLPSSGEVKYDNFNLVSIKENKRVALRRRIGFIFQFYHLLTEFSVLENVCLSAVIANRGKKQEIEKRAKDLLAMVGLSERLEHKPTELSGGERQRAAIARALINEPEIIFADEPTGNLDSEASYGIQEILTKLSKEQGKTLVVVTHNQQMADLAERKINIIDGKIIE